MESETVFISYSSMDTDIVNKIVSMLSKAGIDYWKAPDMIPIGSNYAKEIPGVIKNCKIFLLIITENSQSSIWVEKELDYAINTRRNIVPIKFVQGPVSDMFKFYLNNVQMINVDGDVEAGVNTLKEKIIYEIKGPKDEKIDKPVYEKEASEDREIHYTENEQIKAKKKKILANAGLTYNRVPLECGFCGGKLRPIINGIFECEECKKESYDDFQKVKRYLFDNGPSTIIDIEKNTGVPKRNIEYFLEQEKLEMKFQ